MNKIFGVVSLVAVLCAFTNVVHAELKSPFAPLGSYDTVVLGNLTQYNSGDAEGYLAVKGNMVVNGQFGVANNSQGSTDPNLYGLVVGGQLKNQNSWEVKEGSLYYGSLEGTSPHLTNGGAGRWIVQEGGTCPVDFASIESQMRANSAALASLAASGTVTSAINPWWGGASFTVTGSGQHVINMNIEDLYSDTNGYWLKGVEFFGLDPDSTLLINIIGMGNNDTLNFDSGFNQNTHYDNIVLNLVGVENMVVNNTEIWASVIGVNTNLTLNSSSINGTSIFNDVVMQGSGSEFHNRNPFTGEYDFPGGGDPGVKEITPEPATLLLLGLGGLVLPVVRRRMTK